MLIAIVILSVLLFFAILFAVAFLVHAKYTMSMFKIEAEYAQSLKKATDSLITHQMSLISNQEELLKLSTWALSHEPHVKEEPAEEEEEEDEEEDDDEDVVESVQEVYDLDDIDFDDIDRIAEQAVDNYPE